MLTPILVSLVHLVLAHDTLIALARIASGLPSLGRRRKVDYRALANEAARAAAPRLPAVGDPARAAVLADARARATALVASLDMAGRFALAMRRGPAPTLDNVIAAWRALPGDAFHGDDLARYRANGWPEAWAADYLRGAVWSCIETDSVCPEAAWVVARAGAVALSLRYLARAEAAPPGGARTDVVDRGDAGVTVTLPCDDPDCDVCVATRQELHDFADARRDEAVEHQDAALGGVAQPWQRTWAPSDALAAERAVA